MVNRTERIRPLQGQQDPYEALGATIGGACADLARQLLADLSQVIRASAVPTTTQVAADTSLTLGLKQVAERLNIGLTTARRLVAEGQLPSIMLTEGRRVVAVSDLEQFIERLRESQGQPPPAPPHPSPAPPSRPRLRRGREGAS
jgi:excisionase family DNA binding protein